MKVMTKFVSISSDNSIDYNDQDDAEDRKVLTMIIQKRKRKKERKKNGRTRASFFHQVPELKFVRIIGTAWPSWLHIFSVNKAYIWAISVYFSQVDIVIMHAGEASKNCFLGTGSPKSVSPQKAFTHFRCKLGNFANYALLLDFWPPKL